MIGEELGLNRNKVAGILSRLRKHYPNLRSDKIMQLRVAEAKPKVAPKMAISVMNRPPIWLGEGSALRAMILENPKLHGPLERVNPGNGVGWARAL
jgi:hypothetical protein